MPSFDFTSEADMVALKNAIDWASRPYGKNSFNGKPTAGIGASGGAIGTAAAANTPSGRYNGVSWVDHKGSAWIYGGTGNDDDGRIPLRPVFDDRLTGLVDDALSVPRDLGDLQRLQAVEDVEPQQMLRNRVDRHDKPPDARAWTRLDI